MSEPALSNKQLAKIRTCGRFDKTADNPPDSWKLSRSFCNGLPALISKIAFEPGS